MEENKYQVYRRYNTNTIQLIASDMSLNDATLFMSAWMGANYIDFDSVLELRKQPERHLNYANIIGKAHSEWLHNED